MVVVVYHLQNDTENTPLPLPPTARAATTTRTTN
jgi:hypothetical protein